MKRSLLGAVALIALTLPSQAADPFAGRMGSIFEPNSSANFSGLYLGGQLGGAFGSDDGREAVLGRGVSGDYSGDPSFFDEGRFSGGAHVGYDVEFDSILIGAIADVSYVDANLTRRLDVGADTYVVEQDLDVIATLRARAGVTFDRFLVYGTGGLAYGRTDESLRAPERTTASSDFLSSIDGSSDDLGYAVGAGAEFLATQNLSFGLEYLYTDLGKRDVTVTLRDSAGGPAGLTAVSSDDLRFHTVWAKASYRFD